MHDSCIDLPAPGCEDMPDLSAPELSPRKFVCHSYAVLSIATQYGWLPGASYTNLRNVTRFEPLGFLDINWREYNFAKHLVAVKARRPLVTVAQDVTDSRCLDRILDQARELALWAGVVVVVPKCEQLLPHMPHVFPAEFVLGYSVPTRYGGTTLPPACFADRPVHLLGGHPLVQRRLADTLHVVSLDCNRFVLEAAYGKSFDGHSFKKRGHDEYLTCVQKSIVSINRLWECHLVPESPLGM